MGEDSLITGGYIDIEYDESDGIGYRLLERVEIKVGDGVYCYSSGEDRLVECEVLDFFISMPSDNLLGLVYEVRSIIDGRIYYVMKCYKDVKGGLV